MRARGHKWSQATVWSVEKGDRPLRYLEAVDLAEVLGAEIWDFGDDSFVVATEQRMRRMARSNEALEKAIADFLAAQADLALVKHGIEERAGAKFAADYGIDDWLETSVADVLEEGERRFHADAVGNEARRSAMTEFWAKLDEENEAGSSDGEHPATP